MSVTQDVETRVYGIDIKAEICHSVDLSNGNATTEAKGTAGVGSNGVFVSNTTNHETGENTTRAGVQAEVTTPKVVNTEVKAGINFSVGQEEKK